MTSAAERARIDAGSVTATALWTAKEAVLKATGTGILAAPEVEIEGAVGHHAGRAYHLKRLDLDRNFVLTIATTAPVLKIRVVQATTSTLFDVPPIGRRRSSA